MLQRHVFEIARIQVPAKRKRELDPAKVAALAEDIMENGQKTPIQCRIDKKDGEHRLILIEGQHRLEALRALGETTVVGYVVQARVK